MKTRICLFIGFVLLSCSNVSSNETETSGNISQKGTINVFSSPELYQITSKWAGVYGALNPALKINITKSSDNEISGMLSSGSQIGFIADESFTSLINKPSWSVIVGRDVIVPVMNAANPLRDEIYMKGITAERLTMILENPEKQNWATLVGNTQDVGNVPLHIYTIMNSTVVSGIENFLNLGKTSTNGIKAVSRQEFVQEIQKDPNALGFCKLVQIIDNNSQNITEGLKIVPIDKNGNGKLDYMENIYDNLQSFSRGVWIGKYPKALSGNIYSVSSKKPGNAAQVAFLQWVLTDGQKLLNTNGYSDLVSSEIKIQLAKISEPINYTPTQPQMPFSILKWILLALFTLLVTVFVLDLIFRTIKNTKESSAVTTFGKFQSFDETSVIIPKGIYYDKTHTWAFMKKDGTVKLGIDDFLQHVTGNLTRVEMKRAGEKIKKGEHLFTIIRKGKQLNIYSPVSGTIISQNESLVTDSSLINSSPYSEGWVYIIEPTNWLLEIQFLAMAEKYRVWIKDEFTRLRDFFAASLKNGSPELSLVVLQDGGTLKDSVLADLEPEIWEDFQTKFIDNAGIIK